METRSKTIVLSSHHKKRKNDTATSFTCHLDGSLDVNDVSRIVIKSFHCTHLFTNITANNNELHFVVGGITHIATVPVGQYGVTSFIAALTVAINATGATTVTSIVQDPATFQLTLTTADAVTYLSQHDVNDITKKVSSLNTIIGCDSFDNATGTVVTLSGILNLTGPKSIHVHSNTLAAGHAYDSQGNSHSLVCIIPITVAFGQSLNWYSSSHLLSFVDCYDADLGTIDISLRDEHDDVLSLPPNLGTTIEVMCVY